MESLRTENHQYGHQDFNRDHVEKKERRSFWNRDEDKEKDKEKEREREKARERDERGERRYTRPGEDPQPDFTRMFGEMERHTLSLKSVD